MAQLTGHTHPQIKKAVLEAELGRWKARTGDVMQSKKRIGQLPEECAQVKAELAKANRELTAENTELTQTKTELTIAKKASENNWVKEDAVQG